MSKYTGGLPSKVMDGCSNNSFSNVFRQITVAAGSIAGSEKTNSNCVWSRILDEERASFLWMCYSTPFHQANEECSYVLLLPRAHDNHPYFFLFLCPLGERVAAGLWEITNSIDSHLILFLPFLPPPIQITRQTERGTHRAVYCWWKTTSLVLSTMCGKSKAKDITLTLSTRPHKRQALPSPQSSVADGYKYQHNGTHVNMMAPIQPWVEQDTQEKGWNPIAR